MKKTTKINNPKGQSLEELQMLFKKLGEPSYRAEQLFRWMYGQLASSYDEITTLPKSLREKLQKYGPLSRAEIISQTGNSTEDTVKFLIGMEDGMNVEAVYIPEDDRITVCLSSQVGCAVDCDFCATGKMGFFRHLDAGEIFEQFRLLQNFSDRKITNIVFMGMGEPFNNYDNVIRAAELFNHDKGPNIGRKRITISTSGIIPRIMQYTNEDQPYRLAISLNATTNRDRSRLIPINKKWAIRDILNAAKRYTEISGNRITFEYVLIEGITDRVEDAHRLRSMLRDIPCKLNVIPFNEVGSEYRRPSDKRIEAFLSALHPTPFALTVRWSRGRDINAACGQLYAANELKSQKPMKHANA